MVTYKSENFFGGICEIANSKMLFKDMIGNVFAEFSRGKKHAHLIHGEVQEYKIQTITSSPVFFVDESCKDKTIEAISNMLERTWTAFGAARDDIFSIVGGNKNLIDIIEEANQKTIEKRNVIYGCSL